MFDPFSAAAGVAGVGFSIAGGLMGMSAAKDEANISKQEAMVEMKENDVRQATMNHEAQRMGLQQLRQEQQARSMALTTATGQGAAYGQSSAVGGAIGSIAGQANTNRAGILYNQQQSNTMFGLTGQLDALKMQMADAQSSAATAQGISSIGSSLMSVSKII